MSEESAIPLPRATGTLIGHEAAETAMHDAISSGRIPHAWMITGPPGIGKATLAFRFARYVLSGGTEEEGPGLFGDALPPPAASLQVSRDDLVFAQIAADMWKVPIDDVYVAVADTATVSHGYGTIASRSTVTASGAIKGATDRVMEKVYAIAGEVLEASIDDLEIRDGGVGVKGVPDMHMSYRDVAREGRPGWESGRPEGIEAGLEASSYYEPPTVTWAYASNAAIVEVDPATGKIDIERYVEVHDAGVLVNPGLADGQVKGGLAQGIGGGLFEELSYDANGQLLTGSLMDYLLPSASDIPPLTVIHHESPSPLNALGVKGLGEGGAIAPPVVIANAVCDALRPFRAELNTTPVRWGDVAAFFGDDPFEITGPSGQ